MKKVSDILTYFIKELNSSYLDNREITSICYIVIEYYLNLNKSETIIYKDNIIHSDRLIKLKEVVKDLKKGMPIQYILSETHFNNLKLRVNENVLIPRSETEELVNWIIDENKGSYKKYLDIGTGSACIIISIAKSLEGKFEAMDISTSALEVAQTNCNYHMLDINLKEFDILQHDLDGKWDVIVSNPPYVLKSESKELLPNVFYEPEISLFVEDRNPLLYYKTIIDQAMNCLNNDGILYFEINENFGTEIIDLLLDKGFVNIELKKDINDKERMIKAVWK